MRGEDFIDELPLWDEATILPLTPEGRVTVRILRLNDTDRLGERQRLMEAGLYLLAKVQR